MSKQVIKDIILKGTVEEKRLLFLFNAETTTTDKIYKKFLYFSRAMYPRYFTTKQAPFHKEMLLNYIRTYKGEQNFLNIAFRGSAKTTLLKLFVTFCLLNDEAAYRKYMKILTKDIKNAKQIVTDIYNLIVEVKGLYGSPFDVKGDKKREETMSSFTLENDVKIAAGTVGQIQRGHVQDAYRPDFVWFDDIEDSASVRSAVVTEGIISKADEAIQGRSVNGNYVVTANYISDIGVIENFRKKDVVEMITPIMRGDVITWDYFTPEKVASIKKDAEDWFGEYMCDPISGNKREFKTDLFKYITWEELQNKNTVCYLTIDSAVSKKDSADYTGFTLNWVDSENFWYLKSWRERLNSAELIDKMFMLFTKYKPEKVGIEKTTFTEAIQPFLQDEERKRNIFMPMVELKHGGINKEVRIRGLLPRYESGSVYHIVGECNDLEQELLRFPRSEHDDTADSLAYQLKIAEKPYSHSMYDDIFDEDDELYSEIGI